MTNQRMTDNNQQIRQRIKQRRLALSEIERQQAAEKILTHLSGCDVFDQADHIACYYAVNGEVATQPIINHILHKKQSCYLPCLSDNNHENLIFAQFDQNTALIGNRYQIPEPDLSRTKPFPAEQLHCVLVPLVAFDDQGNRLGMGAGYYDRTFAFNKTHEKSVPLIGLAYDFQYVENFLVNEWDIPLAGVVTTSGLRIYSPDVFS